MTQGPLEKQVESWEHGMSKAEAGEGGSFHGSTMNCAVSKSNPLGMGLEPNCG